MNIILLNGPPRCGKDTIGNLLRRDYGYSKKSFALPLKRAIASFFNQDLEWLEANKDETLHGVRYRDLLIDLSEKVIKPRFDNKFFGEQCAWEINSYAPHNFVITDCGFEEEVHAFIECVDPMYTCHLWRVSRPGCDFDSDSREFVEPLPALPFHHIHNDGSLQDLHLEVLRLMRFLI